MPYIKKIRKDNHWYNEGYRYEVVGKYGTDLVISFSHAIRFFLWHCGLPAKIIFKK